MHHLATPSDMRNYTTQIPQLPVDIHIEDEPELPGAVVLDTDRLQRPLLPTRTILQRRSLGAVPRSAQVYAALHGCTIATARQILAGERLPSWLSSRNRDDWDHRTEAAGSPPIEPAATGARDRGPHVAPPQTVEPAARQPGQRSIWREKSPPRAADSGPDADETAAEIDRIIDHVCAEWEVELSMLRGNTRDCRHVLPRHVAIALIAGRCGDLTFRAIAGIFGRCHSTVTCALRSHRRRLSADAAYAAAVARVVARLSIPACARPRRDLPERSA